MPTELVNDISHEREQHDLKRALHGTDHGQDRDKALKSFCVVQTKSEQPVWRLLVIDRWEWLRQALKKSQHVFLLLDGLQL